MKTKRTIAIIAIAIIVFFNLLPDTYNHSTQGNRNPLTLVSWECGTVLDEEGNGQLKTPGVDSYYNYIKYSAKETRTGDNVFTVYVYNPLTMYNDDILERYDFIISNKKGN